MMKFPRFLLLIFVLIPLVDGNAFEAVPDSYSVAQGGVLLTGADPAGVFDNDDAVVIAELVSDPSFGTLQFEADGNFLYTLTNGNFIGTDQFTYSAQSTDPLLNLIGSDDDWRYFHPLNGIDPALTTPDWDTSWTGSAFDDSAWDTGSGLMGYGEISSLGVPRPLDTHIGIPDSFNRRTAYFRRLFDGVEGTHNLSLELSRDDGAIIYINGEEIGRSHLAGATTFAASPDTYALMVDGGIGSWVGGSDEGVLVEERFTGVELLDGVNVLAISLHNTFRSSTSSLPGSSDLNIQVTSLKIVPERSERSEAEVTITVEDANLPPMTVPDRYVIRGGVNLDTVADGATSLYANDGLFGVDGQAYDPILNIVVTGQMGGQVSVIDKETGHFIFVPDQGFVGMAGFEYSVEDKDGGSQVENVRIKVIAEMITSARDDSYTTNQGESFSTGAAPPSPAGVFDNDGAVVMAELVSDPSFGTLQFEADGNFLYTLTNGNFIGTDQFTYSAQATDPLVDLIDPDDDWRYFHPLDGIDPALTNPDWDTSWTGLAFDDSAWDTGSGLMGYGEISFLGVPRPLDTHIGIPDSFNRRTAYFRRLFDGVEGTHSLSLELVRDDGAIIYINGEEIGRSHLAGATTFATSPDTYTLMVDGGNGSWVARSDEGVLVEERFAGVELLDGVNVLAISLHNAFRFPTGPLPGSSDLNIQVTSLKIVPGRSEAEVTITVEDANLAPMTVPDRYVIGGGVDLDTVADGAASLYANDGLLAEGGDAYDPILSAQLSEQIFAVGNIESFDPQSGDFRFVPVENATGEARFSYTVTDKDGTSAPSDILIEVQDVFSNWQIRNFGENLPIGEEGFTIDREPDGLPDFWEYAFGHDPLVADADRFSLLRVLFVDGKLAVEFEIPSPPPYDVSYRVIGGGSLDAMNEIVASRSRLADWSGDYTLTPLENGRARVLVIDGEGSPATIGGRFLKLEAIYSP